MGWYVLVRRQVSRCVDIGRLVGVGRLTDNNNSNNS